MSEKNLNDDIKDEDYITLNFGGNSSNGDDKSSFRLNLGKSSNKAKFITYLSNIISSNTNKKLTPKTQNSYVTLLECFIRDELEPLGIAKRFDIYRVDSSPSSIEGLSELHKQINKFSSPLYKINKNDYRKFKRGGENKFYDRNIRNYLGGDPSAALTHYINFLNSLNAK